MTTNTNTTSRLSGFYLVDNRIWHISDHANGWYTIVLWDESTNQAVLDKGRLVTRKVRAKALDNPWQHNSDDTWSPVSGAEPEQDGSAADVVPIEQPLVEVPESELNDDQDDDDEPSNPMSQQLARFRARYVKAKNASGTTTAHCGDELAQLLLPLTVDEVCELGSQLLDLPQDKYAGLNPGQQRMNWGNRIRAQVKKGNLTLEQVREALLVEFDIGTEAATASEQEAA